LEKLSLLKEYLEQIDCAFLENESMKEHITFKVGGPADLFIKPVSQDQCARVLSFCEEQQIPLRYLGGGSNVIVHDFGIRGAVLATGGLNDLELLDGCRIRCGAGVKLSRLCSFALEHSLTGLEFAWGIPGTLGGAVFMNAGAYDGCMKDVLESSSHITPEGVTETLPAEQLKLGYRTSVYQKNKNLITGAVLKLAPDSQEKIRNTMDDLMNRRRTKQPLEYPSAGSTFKRPEGHFAGALIEQCGLKGFSVGGAQVSEKHAGFVVNKGGATTADILELGRRVSEKVLNETGVELEMEVKYIG
jgi:UDP-N-acetylmuramate dehydrogenase